MLRYQQGNSSEAVELTTKAIAIKPNYHEAYSNLGNALAALGRLDEAVSAYRQAIAIEPDYAEAHNDLARSAQGAWQARRGCHLLKASYRHQAQLSRSVLQSWPYTQKSR